MEMILSQETVPPRVLTHLSDDVLMSMMTQSDEQALGVLYDRYGGLVYSLALHITGDLATAEKVTEDIFQRVWTTADALQAGCLDQGWIIALTKRHAMTVLCDQQRRPQHTPPVAAYPL